MTKKQFQTTPSIAMATALLVPVLLIAALVIPVKSKTAFPVDASYLDTWGWGDFCVRFDPVTGGEERPEVHICGCISYTGGVSYCSELHVTSQCGSRTDYVGQSCGSNDPLDEPDYLIGNINYERAYGSDTLAAGSLYPNYQFIFPQSDEILTSIIFSDLTYDGSRLDLDNYTFFDYINSLPSDSLSDLSESKNFYITSGDTLRFARELSWAGTGDSGMQYVNNYCGVDTLQFIVRLRSTSGSFSYTIDSLVIVPPATSGDGPSLYGTLAQVLGDITYVIPSGHSSDEAFVDIVVSDEGPGPYYPVRVDRASGLRQLWSSSEWIAFELAGGLNKGIVTNDVISKHQSTIQVEVRTLPAERESISVRVLDPSASPKRIIVSNAAGERVTVLSNSTSDREFLATFNLSSAGTYYLVVISDNKFQTTRMFQVN